MNTVIKLQIQTTELSKVKDKIKAIAVLFPDHSEISIEYCGWAITCDTAKDTVFANSGIIVDSGKLGSKRFLARVDGENMFCVPTLDYDGNAPYWYLEFSTKQYLTIR
jgi:hypothetical protein